MAVKLSTLTTIIEAAKMMDYWRPKTGNCGIIRSRIMEMSDHQLGELFRCVDEIILNSRLLESETADVVKS